MNLPAKDRVIAPHDQTLLNKNTPAVTLPVDAGKVCVIANNHESHHGPAHTLTPINVWDIRLNQGHGAGRHSDTLQVNGVQIARDAEVVMFGRAGSEVVLEASNDATLLLSGEPIDEPIVATVRS